MMKIPAWLLWNLASFAIGLAIGMLIIWLW